MQHRPVAAAAALLADPSRAAMLLALMDGRSRTAKTLALDAGVTPQCASSHLKKLVAARMLVAEARGRSKHFSLAGHEVAEAVESLSGLGGSPRFPAAARELRFARCCYDHLAGRLGVAVTERLLLAGDPILRALGIDVAQLAASRRPMFRCCVDWTERRPHVAGAIGAALLRHYTRDGWLLRARGSRRLVVTPRGREMFVREIGIEGDFFNSVPGT
ncbi:MAG TPA: winged helix-turn-helix domain-containing protein [Burkholderiales bacterium]|nr:winged helix-turn-helix domain-containing protein [Burkholderiales bacterium]